MVAFGETTDKTYVSRDAGASWTLNTTTFGDECMAISGSGRYAIIGRDLESARVSRDYLNTIELINDNIYMNDSRTAGISYEGNVMATIVKNSTGYQGGIRVNYSYGYGDWQAFSPGTLTNFVCVSGDGNYIFYGITGGFCYKLSPILNKTTDSLTITGQITSQNSIDYFDPLKATNDLSVSQSLGVLSRSLFFGSSKLTPSIDTSLISVGQTFVNVKSSVLNWYKCAISSDGRYGIASCMIAGNAYISSDFCRTWGEVKPKGSDSEYYGVGISADGRIMSIINATTGCYISRDFGSTWALLISASGLLNTYVSSDGKYITASSAVLSPYLYVSNDYGRTFTSYTTPAYSGVACLSSDGKFCLLAIPTSSTTASIYLASSGVPYIFTEIVPTSGAITGLSSLTIYDCSCAMSSDGKYMYCAFGGGGIWYSSNYGQSFTKSGASSDTYDDITCDASGQFCYACCTLSHNVYFSQDYGITWTAVKTYGNNVIGIRSSADGTYVLLTIDSVGIDLIINQPKIFYGAQQIDGTLSLATTSNQLKVGSGNNILTINSTQTANFTATIPSIGANLDFVMNTTNQTISDFKTFDTRIASSKTSNQLVLGNTSANYLTITSSAPSSAIFYTIPDVANDTFAMLNTTTSLTASSLGCANSSLSIVFSLPANAPTTVSANQMIVYSNGSSGLVFKWNRGGTTYTSTLAGS
ncbi:Sortilin, neurotensin receptor 3 [uncultured archaeon]|nr:Sortilin, neurotensin receptor 3 [uncultured archaeon]